MSAVYQAKGSRYIYLQSDNRWYVFDSLSTPLGSGTMGIVYKGYDCITQEPIAVKMIKAEYSENYQIRQRVRVEAELKFLHPNIVRIIGFCEYDPYHGPIFILSNLVQGVTFDTYCATRISDMDPFYRMMDIVNCSIPIIQALGYVHGMGLIHRDVKPSNIMISDVGEPKLMDLGIAKYEYLDSFPEQGFIGTALYASPESITGDMVDQRTDIYSMGVTMYEMLTGYNPFEATTQEEVLDMQLRTDLPKHPAIPRSLYRILRKATEKNQYRRYDSAIEFADDLASFMTDNV